LKLITQLKQQNIFIGINDLMHIPTPRLVNSMVDKSNDGFAEIKCIVPLKLNANARQNIFFIHAVGGHIIGYMDLINKLSDKYNYYGIQNINVHGLQLLQVSSLEELATIYVQAVLNIQSDGEFIFAGSSMGGTIGFEMSRQLIKTGKTVRTLFMLDTWAYFSNEFGKEENFRRHMIEQAEYRKDLQNVDIDAKTAETLMVARWGLMQILTTYKPNKFDVPVVLFKAKELDRMHSSNIEDRTNGWSQYIEKVDVFNVDGNHATILLEPGLSQIYVAMNNFLNFVPYNANFNTYQPHAAPNPKNVTKYCNR